PAVPHLGRTLDRAVRYFICRDCINRRYWKGDLEHSMFFPPIHVGLEIYSIHPAVKNNILCKKRAGKIGRWIIAPEARTETVMDNADHRSHRTSFDDFYPSQF